jgi:hypothetical protein
MKTDIDIVKLGLPFKILYNESDYRTNKRKLQRKKEYNFLLKRNLPF